MKYNPLLDKWPKAHIIALLLFLALSLLPLESCFKNYNVFPVPPNQVTKGEQYAKNTMEQEGHQLAIIDKHDDNVVDSPSGRDGAAQVNQKALQPKLSKQKDLIISSFEGPKSKTEDAVTSNKQEKSAGIPKIILADQPNIAKKRQQAYLSARIKQRGGPEEGGTATGGKTGKEDKDKDKIPQGQGEQSEDNSNKEQTGGSGSNGGGDKGNNDGGGDEKKGGYTEVKNKKKKKKKKEKEKEKGKEKETEADRIKNKLTETLATGQGLIANLQEILEVNNNQFLGLQEILDRQQALLRILTQDTSEQNSESNTLDYNKVQEIIANLGYSIDVIYDYKNNLNSNQSFASYLLQKLAHEKEALVANHKKLEQKLANAKENYERLNKEKGDLGSLKELEHRESEQTHKKEKKEKDEGIPNTNLLIIQQELINAKEKVEHLEKKQNILHENLKAIDQILQEVEEPYTYIEQESTRLADVFNDLQRGFRKLKENDELLQFIKSFTLDNNVSSIPNIALEQEELSSATEGDNKSTKGEKKNKNKRRRKRGKRKKRSQERELHHALIISEKGDSNINKELRLSQEQQRGIKPPGTDEDPEQGKSENDEERDKRKIERNNAKADALSGVIGSAANMFPPALSATSVFTEHPLGRPFTITMTGVIIIQCLLGVFLIFSGASARFRSLISIGRNVSSETRQRNIVDGVGATINAISSAFLVWAGSIFDSAILSLKIVLIVLGLLSFLISFIIGLYFKVYAPFRSCWRKR